MTVCAYLMIIFFLKSSVEDPCGSFQPIHLTHKRSAVQHSEETNSVSGAHKLMYLMLVPKLDKREKEGHPG